MSLAHPFLKTMKKILLYLFVLLISLPTYGKKIENMFVMRNTTAGMLYFIKENKFTTQDEAYTSLEVDITYLERDSIVSLKMSIFGEEVKAIDSIQIAWADSKDVCQSVRIMYKDIKKKNKWENRCDCTFSYTSVRDAFTSETSPMIVLYSKNTSTTFIMNNNQWKSIYNNLNRIFYMIDVNNEITTGNNN